MAALVQADRCLPVNTTEDPCCVSREATVLPCRGRFCVAGPRSLRVWKVRDVLRVCHLERTVRLTGSALQVSRGRRKAYKDRTETQADRMVLLISSHSAVLNWGTIVGSPGKKITRVQLEPCAATLKPPR